MTGEGDAVYKISISSMCEIIVSLTSQYITAVLQLLPAPGHPPAHVPVWDTLFRTGEVGILAKIFTVMVGVVAARVAKVMDTCHYTTSTLSIPALFVLCRWHAALLSITKKFNCCVTTLAIIISVDALVTACSLSVIIFTSVTVLELC